jgi:hypothetical protein
MALKRYKVRSFSAHSTTTRRFDCLIERLLLRILINPRSIGLSDFQHENDYEGEFQDDPHNNESIGRSGRTLAVCLLLALIGSGLAFLWYYYGAAITGAAASKTDAIAQLTVTVQGLQQFQQGIAVDVRRNQEILQAQQADIKRLSDEVAQLATKLDFIQSSAREAQAAAQPVHKPPPRKLASKPAVHEPAPQTAASLTPEEKQ